jgi:hypothetical protein
VTTAGLAFDLLGVILLGLTAWLGRRHMAIGWNKGLKLEGPWWLTVMEVSGWLFIVAGFTLQLIGSR